MKKSILKTMVLLAVSAAILLSCSSAKDYTSYTNEIKSDSIAINTYFDRDDYSVIGTAEGESDYIWYNAFENEYVGDSEKYGYISQPTTVYVGDGYIVGTGKVTAQNLTDEEIVRRARLNANYILIEKAYAMGGDTILEPIYSVVIENSSASGTEVRKAKVKVRAKVIQLKLQ